MKIRYCAAALVVVLVPAFAGAQAPVATALHQTASRMEKNLVAAAEAMPEDKYSFKPTPAQMTFGAIMAHLAGGNDALCSAIAGAKAPAREKVPATASKAALIARLKETFTYCHTVLGPLDDSKLGDELTVFGEKMTRGALVLETVGDWSDHYSQVAIYMRLNGLLPPTAKK
jgi:uncharacterized damage-inducible protein DinB